MSQYPGRYILGQSLMSCTKTSHDPTYWLSRELPSFSILNCRPWPFPLSHPAPIQLISSWYHVSRRVVQVLQLSVAVARDQHRPLAVRPDPDPRGSSITNRYPVPRWLRFASSITSRRPAGEGAFQAVSTLNNVLVPWSSLRKLSGLCWPPYSSASPDEAALAGLGPPATASRFRKLALFIVCRP